MQMESYTSVKVSSRLKEDDFVNFNVCGMQYETLKSTLQKYPTTLLGKVSSENTHFFDRNRQCFEAILYYYQSSGMLIRPSKVPMALFAEEVSFFGLGEEVLFTLQEKEGYIPEEVLLPKGKWQRIVWELVEHPDSSIIARCITVVSVVVIMFSIIAFCMETMPYFSDLPTQTNSSSPAGSTMNMNNQNMNDHTMHMMDMNHSNHNMNNHNIAKTEKSISSGRQPWSTFELVCIIWFTAEYIVRFVSSPSKRLFIKSYMNLIDLLAILPYYISLLLSILKIVDVKNATPLSVLRVVRLVRVFRVFKLSRHSMGLQILGQTLKTSLSELGMLVFFLLLGVILFSSALYYAEHGENHGMFTSIPDAFWYSLVTMTTVGYGDQVPTTLIGKLIGSLCAVSGVLTIALPVPVIVSNFEFYYKRDRLNYEKRNNKKSKKNNIFQKSTIDLSEDMSSESLAEKSETCL